MSFLNLHHAEASSKLRFVDFYEAKRSSSWRPEREQITIRHWIYQGPGKLYMLHKSLLSVVETIQSFNQL